MEINLAESTSIPKLDHTDLPAFINWDGKPIKSQSEQSALYRSLVQMVKDERQLPPSIEDKAVSFLKQIKIRSAKDVDSFLLDLVPSSQVEPSKTFVESVVELISIPNEKIKLAILELIATVVNYSFMDRILILLQNDLIPKLISSLDVFSPAFTEAEKIHASLITILEHTIYSSTFDIYHNTTIVDDNDQQQLFETVHNHVIVPSNDAIWVSVFTTNSGQTFYTNVGGEMLKRWNTVVRSLRMEGFEDIYDQRLFGYLTAWDVIPDTDPTLFALNIAIRAKRRTLL
ncbi:hypothetical protein BLNAU_14241 [Blattamonas nauphoetae]|uniref:Uncharacterized protein n=1 Tax=Blattamonas nauphoetae TaxID=2049346 RepID=A0ABQ9XHN7_9EUKA|nr:hypothetical protein BLNAU_14241 [Blattamonas nauphoetae]